MSLSLDEWKRSPQRIAHSRPSDLVRFQLGAQAQVGARAETVLNHEGYQVFLDHMTEWAAEATKARDALADRILRGEIGENLMKAQLEHAERKGEARALERARDLIPTLIERGQKASQQLAEAGA